MRESERERKREREREKERERVREIKREREERERGERDRILRCIWTANRWRRGKNQAKKFTRQFSRVLTSGPNSLGFSRESPAGMWYYVAYVYNEELVSPIGNQRVGIFPPKSKSIFFLKSLKGHATVVGGHATDGRLSNNVFERFKQFGKILKKSLNGHATVVGGYATVGRLSNNVFGPF